VAQGQRYTALVTGLKLTLPLVALGLLSTLFLLTERPNPEDAIPYATVDVEELAREQRLTQPRFAGVLEDGRELTLVAEAIVPNFDTDRTMVNAVFTEEVTGRLALSLSDILTLQAPFGRFDVSSQSADLSGGVEAETTLGYRLITEVLSVEWTRFDMETEADVDLAGPGLTITAGKMRLTGPPDQALVQFTGGVRLVYDAPE